VTCYEIWCDLRNSSQDLEFCNAIENYLGHLRDRGMLASFRIRRRKFGLAPDGFAEFNITMEFEDMAQMDRAFNYVATRSDPIEHLHSEVFRRITNGKFALYRDFPDPVRNVPNFDDSLSGKGSPTI
jgi:hypothetical protein